MTEETKNLNNPEEGLSESQEAEQPESGTQVEGEEEQSQETPLTKEQFEALQREKEKLEEQYKALQRGFTKVSQENAQLKKLKERIEQLEQERIDEETNIEHYIKKYPNDPYKGLNEWRKASEKAILRRLQMEQYRAEAQERVAQFKKKLLGELGDEDTVNKTLVRMAEVINEYNLEFTPEGLPRRDALEIAYKIVKAEKIIPKTKQEIKEEIKKEEERKKQHSLPETPKESGKKKKTKEELYLEFLRNRGGKKTLL